jgi:S-(hydroxymethyl)glutathione dehydrogenase/alcohol dehydrogenase
MKAAVTHALGAGFVIEDVEIDAPADGEVLVEIRASGLCHSDLTMSVNDMGQPFPAIFGHEIAGVAIAVGRGVRDIAVGDHVVGCLVMQCGRCRKCLAGKPFLCLHPEATQRPTGAPSRLSQDGVALAQGMGIGGFAQQALISEQQLVTVPDSLPFPQAALLGCGVVTGAGAVINTADVDAGDSVAVIGCGGVGLNAISGARIAGATRIVAIDLAPAKLETARRFGATEVVDSSSVDAVEAVLAGGGGVDHVFDFVGLESVSSPALGMLAPGGGMYLIGLAKFGIQFSFDHLGAVAHQRRVQGVYMGSTNFKRDVPLYADLYLQGRMNLDDLVSKEIALADVATGYDALKDTSVNRVVVTSF